MNFFSPDLVGENHPMPASLSCSVLHLPACELYHILFAAEDSSRVLQPQHQQSSPPPAQKAVHAKSATGGSAAAGVDVGGGVGKEKRQRERGDRQRLADICSGGSESDLKGERGRESARPKGNKDGAATLVREKSGTKRQSRDEQGGAFKSGGGGGSEAKRKEKRPRRSQEGVLTMPEKGVETGSGVAVGVVSSSAEEVQVE